MNCVIWSMNKESCNECPCENCGGNRECTPENPRCHEVCSVCETGINTEKFEEALIARVNWRKGTTQEYRLKENVDDNSYRG